MSVGLHQVYVFSGTPFEIGRQHGSALAQEIVSEMSPALQEYSRARAEAPEVTLRNFRLMYEPVVVNVLPGAMDEVRGIAEGSSLSVDAAFFAAFRDGTPATFAGNGKGEGACTAFVCTGSRSATGGVMIGQYGFPSRAIHTSYNTARAFCALTLSIKFLPAGQTKDTDAPLDRYRVMRLHDKESGRRHILCTYPGWAASWGLLSGGTLGWVGNSLYGMPPSSSCNLLPTSILKRLAMRLESVEELRSEVSKHGLCFTDGAFTFGDRFGAAFMLECVAGRNEWQEVTTGWAV